MKLIIIPGLHKEYDFEYYTVGDVPRRPNPNFTGCRVTHRLTGKSVDSDHERSREDNEQIAFFLCYLWVEFGVGKDQLVREDWDSIRYRDEHAATLEG